MRGVVSVLDLKRVGAAERGVAACVGAEEVVAADVHYDERVGGGEAAAVGSGWEMVAFEVEGDFGEEVGLVFVAEAAGVAGGVDQGDEGVGVVGEADAAGVAELERSGLAAEEDGWRQEGGGVGGVEDCFWLVLLAGLILRGERDGAEEQGGG